ncbi:MAG: VOC family protein [Thermoplasmata archaeon]
MPGPTKRSHRTKAVFSSVAVVVSSRKRSIKWYADKLGLDVLAAHGHWVTVGRKGRDGVLHLCQASDWEDPIPLEKGLTGICFKLSGDFETACTALRKKGVEFTRPPTKRDWGWGARIPDPDGNEFDLHPWD